MDQTYPYGVLLKNINDHLAKDLNNALREYGLTGPQLQVLLSLDHAPDHTRSMKELEKELHVAQSTTVGIIFRLEQKGFVISYTDKHDRRVKHVRITESGSLLCRKSELQKDSSEAVLIKALSPDEQDLFRDFLLRIWETME